MSQLAVEELDITQNPFTDLIVLVRQLQTLPRLKKLQVSLLSKEQEAIVIEALPNLRFLNGRELFSLKKRDLERVAVQYDMIRELQDEPQKDAQMQSLFNEQVQNIMRDFQLRMQREDSASRAKTFILRARYGLQELCFTALIDYCSKVNSKMAEILKEIHDDHAQIFKEMSAIVLSEEQPAILTQQMEKIEKQDLRIKQLEAELDESKQTIDLLEEENKKFVEIIIRHGRMEKHYQPTIERQRTLPKQIDMDQLKDKSNTFVQQDLLSTTKYMSLKHLKEVILEIYDSKIKYDQRCVEGKIARETMEQHMFTYLNQKYGLKNLIIEQASAIIQSVKKYSAEDNDVLVFAKILRNECDEEFRIVQTQVKQTVSELLRMFIRQKNPFKTLTDIKEVWHSKLGGQLSLEEMTEIVNYMYNQDDSRTILAKILQAKLEYAVFLQILLEFQLHTHEKYLYRFVKTFRQIDTEKRGYVNEKQLTQLFKSFNLALSEKYLQALDPYATGQVTFSSLATFLSQEKAGEKSLLQKISE